MEENMKLAIIGSRGLHITTFDRYLPQNVTEIVSGGALGIDTCARMYAQSHGLKYTEFLPQYDQFGRRAPLVRNLQIIDYADAVLAFWDGESRGTKFVIDKCIQAEKKIRVFILKKQ